MPLHSYSAHACKTSTVCLTQSSLAIWRCNLAPLDHSAATCGTSWLNPGKHFLIQLFFCGVPRRPCFLMHSPVKRISMNTPRNSCRLGSFPLGNFCVVPVQHPKFLINDANVFNLFLPDLQLELGPRFFPH